MLGSPVVSSSWYLPLSDIPPELQDVMQYNLAVGGSCIVNPSGQWVREPVFGQETIVWAEIDQEERRLAKAYFDSVGHYSRFDVLQFLIREEGGGADAAACAAAPGAARGGRPLRGEARPPGSHGGAPPQARVAGDRG